jgi:hypothetical protein
VLIVVVEHIRIAVVVVVVVVESIVVLARLSFVSYSKFVSLKMLWMLAEMFAVSVVVSMCSIAIAIAIAIAGSE